MTDSQLFSLHELKGNLQGRAICLEADIRTAKELAATLHTREYQAYWEGMTKTLTDWDRYNFRLLESVDQIIREAEANG